MNHQSRWWNPSTSGRQQNTSPYTPHLSPGHADETQYTPPPPFLGLGFQPPSDMRVPAISPHQIPLPSHSQPPPARTRRFMNVPVPTLPTRYVHPGYRRGQEPEWHTGECLFCLDDRIPMADAVQPCRRHTYCKECFRNFLNSQLAERKTVIVCPHCKQRGIVTRLADTFVMRHANEEGRKHFAQIVQDRLSLVFECPRCRNKQQITHRDWAQMTTVTCTSTTCGGSLWCKDCRKEVHTSSPHDCEVKHHERSLTELAGRSGWKRCPGCQTMIERIAGCNHMECRVPNCGTHFCYRCGALLFRMRPGMQQEAASQTIHQHELICPRR